MRLYQRALLLAHVIDSLLGLYAIKIVWRKNLCLPEEAR